MSHLQICMKGNKIYNKNGEAHRKVGPEMPERGSKTSTVTVIWANFWNFFGAIQIISCRDCWPWTKPGYIAMTRRQSNIQWSCGIEALPAPEKFRLQKSAGKFLASVFWDQAGILLTDYLPEVQTINAEYCSSLLVQLEDILREKRCGKITKGSCSGTTMPRFTGHL